MIHVDCHRVEKDLLHKGDHFNLHNPWVIPLPSGHIRQSNRIRKQPPDSPQKYDHGYDGNHDPEYGYPILSIRILIDHHYRRARPMLPITTTYKGGPPRSSKSEIVRRPAAPAWGVARVLLRPLAKGSSTDLAGLEGSF